jgi:hypothetical protein
MPKLGKSELLKRLKSRLATLEAGGDVATRDMRSLLTKAQMQDYEDSWKDRQEFKQWLIESRHEIAEYEKILSHADKAWAKHENRTKTRGTPEDGYRVGDIYERALERLGELLAADHSISALLDRPCDLSASGNTSPDYYGVPRYIFSQSHANERKTTRLASKRQFKISAFKMAIEELNAPPIEPAPERVRGLPELLKKARQRE